MQPIQAPFLQSSGSHSQSAHFIIIILLSRSTILIFDKYEALSFIYYFIINDYNFYRVFPSISLVCFKQINRTTNINIQTYHKNQNSTKDALKVEFRVSTEEKMKR